MKLPMQRSEARLCTLLIGAIQLYWSILPTIGSDWRLGKVLRHFQATDQWLMVMGSLGILMMVSALCPWRSGRQIALLLSSASWFGYFGIYVKFWFDTDRALLTPVFMTAPLFGVFCFLLLVNDIMQKHRDRKGV